MKTKTANNRKYNKRTGKDKNRKRWTNAYRKYRNKTRIASELSRYTGLTFDDAMDELNSGNVHSVDGKPPRYPKPEDRRNKIKRKKS